MAKTTAPYFSCTTFALPFAYTVTMKRSSNFCSSMVGTTSPPSILITSGIELLWPTTSTLWPACSRILFVTSAVDSSAICLGLEGFNLSVNGVTVNPSFAASGSAVCFVLVYCEVKIALIPALLSSCASACDRAIPSLLQRRILSRLLFPLSVPDQKYCYRFEFILRNGGLTKHRRRQQIIEIRINVVVFIYFCLCAYLNFSNRAALRASLYRD